ncbi:MAG: LytR/AlgR family response regulator transcription factor [Emergencia timonensis]|uniref:LytR/AlgR family response regulator transcription factor n=1 Tax=Emergencia timonensis TaxID=1776384 RepID=UPI00082D2C8E|nr:LytTR family DNA-binding domain-containing protein [Emergencia timonensis]WNX90041.1 LytTR family DNA-binding domain-containing protein [Emergencia timonensis]
MLKIAICDDEKKLRRDLRNLLAVQMELTGMDYAIQEFDCGESLLAACDAAEQIDILFLDIEMPGSDGMTTAKLLRQSGCKMIIIFVTAYPDFVFQGYEVHAFHYILKPYEEAKIREVLSKAIQEISGQETQFYMVEQKSGTLRLPMDAICYFKSDRRTIHIVTTNDSFTFYGKLDDVEAKLPACFQRVHNRYLVNMHFVTQVRPTSCLCHEEELPVSRAYKQDLAVAFAQMLLH